MQKISRRGSSAGEGFRARFRAFVTLARRRYVIRGSLITAFTSPRARAEFELARLITRHTRFKRRRGGVTRYPPPPPPLCDANHARWRVIDHPEYADSPQRERERLRPDRKRSRGSNPARGEAASLSQRIGGREGCSFGLAIWILDGA